jgi:hypothetical protein
MTRAIIVAVAVVAAACAHAGQQAPADDFPIAQLQYPDGSRLFHLHSPYGFAAKWENGKVNFFFYDKGRTNITTAVDPEAFVQTLSSVPDGAQVAWINTCSAPLHYGMPEEMLSRIRQVLEQKRFKMARIEENNFVLCTCEATNLSFFTSAPLAGRSANQQGGANGRQPSSSETNRTPAAAASRRSP